MGMFLTCNTHVPLSGPLLNPEFAVKRSTVSLSSSLTSLRVFDSESPPPSTRLHCHFNNHFSAYSFCCDRTRSSCFLATLQFTTMARPPPRPLEDYYGILGVAHNATYHKIRLSFLQLATLHHPDKHTGQEQ